MSEEYGKEVCKILDNIWSQLSEMLVELINRKIEIPHAIKVALDGAKVLIILCKYHPKLAFDVSPSMLDSVQGFCVGCCGADLVSRVICELRTAQDLLTLKAVSVFGEEYVKMWQRKLDELWRQVGYEYTQLMKVDRV
ncbi:MAG: hypothetical protein NZ929_01070 [Aigarchaeota archaeon]|nr:hypothetical protein [Aigarchaeota archaeon]MCX8192247.1 hypothetical protein [Nitrososphaeria archaeon]MDW7986145.1 hypothetical protein [Nitrososphaerota archaeon]